MKLKVSWADADSVQQASERMKIEAPNKRLAWRMVANIATSERESCQLAADDMPSFRFWPILGPCPARTTDHYKHAPSPIEDLVQFFS